MNGRKTILLIEDDPGIRDVVSKGLGREGFRVVGCRRGAFAPKMAKRLQPSAIVLDAHLGDGISGFQVCAILKQVSETRHIPVIMISGVCLQEKYDEKALRLGAAGYIRKTELWPALCDKIQALQLTKSQPASVSSATSDPPSGGTVLVADDESEWLTLTSRWLTDAGYSVVTTGKDSVVAALAVKHRPDCIVLDYQMQTLTALDICLLLQKDVATRSIPVVVLTAHAGGKVKSLNVGADQYVLKGPSAEELLAAVKASIRGRSVSSGVVVNGDIRLDPRDRGVYLDSKPLTTLPDNQFDLLCTLILRCPQYVSSRELFERVLERQDDMGESKALDKLVSRLKKNVGHTISKRIHHLRTLGWLYETPLLSPPDASSAIPASRN